MKISSNLTIVASILLVAGCANHERQAKFSESYPNYASSTTSAGNAAGTSQFQGTSEFQTRGGSDQMLVTQVQNALNKDTNLAIIAPRIEVTAQNGTVTLSGSVPSDQDKQRIEAAVKSTAGVVSVNNQLQVSLQPTSERSGQSSRLYQESTGQAPGAQTSISSEPYRTDTTVTDTSKNQPSTTDQSTTQPSSTDLSANSSLNSANQNTTPSTDLTPTSQAGAPNRIYSTNQTSSTETSGQTTDTLNLSIQGSTEMDRTLGQKVMQELRTDATLAGQISAIKLMVDGGKITLRGTVKSDDQKKSIESAVQRVTGVASVDNQIQVSAVPTSSTSDTDQNK
jgi:hyperosmotically inducible periplasmic protein